MVLDGTDSLGDRYSQTLYMQLGAAVKIEWNGVGSYHLFQGGFVYPLACIAAEHTVCHYCAY